MDGKDPLKLENQLCFPLYACAKEIVRKYKPFLDQLDLTYTQFLTMMVLWEKKKTNVKELGACLYLDSGTMTPLLRKLEKKGFLERIRDPQDERNLLICMTRKGEELKKKAENVPSQMGKCVCLTREEAQQLYSLLYKTLNGLETEDKKA